MPSSTSTFRPLHPRAGRHRSLGQAHAPGAPNLARHATPAGEPSGSRPPAASARTDDIDDGMGS